MQKSIFITGKIQEIRQKLARPCTAFETGGFRPSGEDTENWLGRVFLCRPEEAQLVTDYFGAPLFPLAQFYLPALPYVPEQLQHISWLTVFMGEEFPDVWNGQDKNKNGHGWLVRTYTAADTLVHHEYPAQGIKAFPLKPQLFERDFPLWDGGGIPVALEEEIFSLEPRYPKPADENSLKYYDDIGTEHCHLHKFGGYPSFCQGGVCDGDGSLDMGEGYQFMFQISSDAKAQFNVVDSGSLMFSRHPESGDWSLYYDFY